MATKLSASPRNSSSSPKPWKNAKGKKKVVTEAAPASIEIFEGKPTVPGHRVLESTPADGKSYVRILCGADAEFFLPVKVVERFKCVDVILHGEADFKEKLENVIRFPEFRPEVLESVMRFVFIELVDSLKAEKYWGQNAPRIPFQFEVEPDQVMELVYAAHFFGIPTLLSVAGAMIAHHMKSVPDVSSMPPDLAWCVAERFSAEELFDAEERDDFLSLKLDTSSLWEKHSKKLSQECILTPVFSEDPLHYDQWEVLEGPPPTSWKSLFVTRYFQQVADRQNGSTNKALFDEAVQKGKWVYAHTLRPTFWEWVMTGEQSLSFSTFAAQFPNLFSLCLAKVPLGSHLNGGLDFGRMLEGMPFLQLLDLSETGFTREAAVSLSKALKFHQRLQVFRIAYNCIMTEGYTAIVEVLPTARSLKVLDVRENNITMSLTKNAVESIRASALEELYLDGNCRHERLKRHFTVCSGVPASLKRLYLQVCDLDDYLVKLLAEHALKDHAAIERLDLSDNKITSHGASAIFRWMQVNTSLLELCLENNNITDACSPLLRLALRCHPSIEKVSLKGNYSYGEDSIPEVMSAAIQRGDLLLASKQKKFVLDLRSTDVSYANRARIQRQAANSLSLHILV